MNSRRQCFIVVVVPGGHALYSAAGAACTAIRNDHEDTVKGKTAHQNRHTRNTVNPDCTGLGITTARRFST
jgi:hypothetical protein